MSRDLGVLPQASAGEGGVLVRRWRLPTKLGLIVGIPVLCVVAVALVGYRELARLNQDVARMVTVTSKAAALVSDLRTNLQIARRLEFRAVLTRDNTEAQTFANDSRARARQVDDGYRTLVAALTDTSPTSDERKYLEQFRAAWEDYSPNRERTLELAVKKWNVKAQQVTKGRLADKIHDIDETAQAWLRQLDKSAPKSWPPKTFSVCWSRRRIVRLFAACKRSPSICIAS